MFVSSLFALIVAGLSVGSASAQTGPSATQPPTQPVLRIETGMHTANIRRIGVDASGRYLVTGSDDKTVRVWELAAGRLLRTLRPPIGEGDEGKIYAVAISPDGRLIAAGGWTKPETGAHNIYFFDRESGRLALQIGGLPKVVNHLAFSPDGTKLAAALGEGEGIRVFRVADGTEIGRGVGARPQNGQTGELTVIVPQRDCELGRICCKNSLAIQDLAA